MNTKKLDSDMESDSETDMIWTDGIFYFMS